MPQFTVDQAARSLKLAAMLVLAGLDPEERSGGYGAVADLDRNEQGRVSISYEDQIMPSVHGPMGAAAYPGVVVEYGQEEEDAPGRFHTSVILSLSRIVGASLERENKVLNEMGALLADWLYNQQTCPVYEFTSEDDDYATAIVGRVNWYPVYGYDRPRAVTIGENGHNGWLRKEYRFTVCYSCKQT